MRAMLYVFPMVIGVLGAARPATAVPVSIHYVNGSVVANATLDVENGVAVSGTGTIRGGGLIGTLTMTYLFPGVVAGPLAATPASDCSAGAVGCYDVGTFSCGCDFVANDTNFDLGLSMPVDTNGIAFQVGGAALNYGFSLYDAGDGSVGEILVGDAPPQPAILNGGTAGGRLGFRVIPEPASMAMLCPALAGLAAVRRRRRLAA